MLSSSLYRQFGATWAITAPRQLIGDENIVWPLIFLSEAPSHLTPAANPPYWSLCYEVWFYALFGAWFFLRGWARAFVTLGIGVCAGGSILLLMPVWLMGAAASAYEPEMPQRRSTMIGLIVATTLLVMIPATGGTMAGAEWLEKIGIGSLRHAQFVLTDWPMGACVAAMLVCLRTLLPAESAGLAAIERPVRRFAGMSFTLYLLHWPILSTMHTLGWDAGASPLRLVLVLLVPLGIAFILSRALEQTIPAALRSLLRRRVFAKVGATRATGAQTL